jgi:hypothetical protein
MRIIEMKKNEFLKLISDVEDGDEIVFYDCVGNYIDNFHIIKRVVLGKFCRGGGTPFYETYKHYDAWEYLQDDFVVVIGE